MVNVDRDIKKRWMVFALVNLALVVLIFGALLAGFAAYAADSCLGSVIARCMAESLSHGHAAVLSGKLRR